MKRSIFLSCLRTRWLPLMTLGMALLSPAMAADSARISVIGTILPPPCTLSLDNHRVDLGTIQASSLSRTARHSKRDAARIAFEVACKQPSRVRMRFTDNHPDSAPADQPAWAGDFGLGKVAGKKIGSFSMYFEPTTLRSGTRSVKPVYLNAPDGPGASYNDIFSTAQMGWAGAHQDHAGSVDRLNGEIVLSYTLEHADDLPLEREIPFNGWVTIDLEY